MTVLVDSILTLVRLQLGLKSVRTEDRIVEDLGAESLDIVSLIGAVEEKFQIVIEDAELRELRTVADLYDLITRHVGCA